MKYALLILALAVSAHGSLVSVSFFGGQGPMPAVAPKVAMSPKGASQQIPIVATPVAPQSPQGVLITAGTNATLQLSTVMPFVPRFATNSATGQFMFSFSWLNQWTNPMLGYTFTMAWDAVKGVTGYGLVSGTNTVDCGTNRMAQLLFSGQTNTVTAYAYFDNDVPGPRSSPVVAVGKPVFPPVTDFFRTSQSNGVPPVLKIARVTLP